MAGKDDRETHVFDLGHCLCLKAIHQAVRQDVGSKAGLIDPQRSPETTPAKRPKGWYRPVGMMLPLNPTPVAAATLSL